jgi:hypothetical protein
MDGFLPTLSSVFHRIDRGHDPVSDQEEEGNAATDKKIEGFFHNPEECREPSVRLMLLRIKVNVSSISRPPIVKGTLTLRILFPSRP